jgi:hypothetical protein
MTDERMNQERDLFKYGDEDSREIARAEMLRSGTLPIEETVHLLDLASCVRPDGGRVRLTKKSRKALKSLERFILERMRT